MVTLCILLLLSRFRIFPLTFAMFTRVWQQHCQKSWWYSCHNRTFVVGFFVGFVVTGFFVVGSVVTGFFVVGFFEVGFFEVSFFVVGSDVVGSGVVVVGFVVVGFAVVGFIHHGSSGTSTG